MEKILLLCGMADSYFFPALDNVEYVFAKPNNKLFMFLAKVIRELHIPVLHCFYGEWFKKLDQYNKVIFFDLGYQPGMEREFISRNPKIKCYYYNWNTIDNDRKVMKINSFHKIQNVYCTDQGSCNKYNLKHSNIFYSKKWAEQIQINHESEYVPQSILWLGHDKGRTMWLDSIADAMRKFGYKINFFVPGGGNEFGLDHDIPYGEYCNMILDTEILLDLTQKGQAALTLRVMEAIFFGKKLITNNSEVKKLDCYSENNMLVIDPDNIDIKKMRDFLEKDYQPYKYDTLVQYDYTSWIKQFV